MERCFERTIQLQYYSDSSDKIECNLFIIPISYDKVFYISICYLNREKIIIFFIFTECTAVKIFFLIESLYNLNMTIDIFTLSLNVPIYNERKQKE